MTREGIIGWAGRRPATIGLACFLTGWFGIQLAVQGAFGQSTAEWWFYAPVPSGSVPEFQPGYLFAPISHDLGDIRHLGSNVAILLVVGSFAEPYIDGRRVLVTVVGFGYLGTYLTNLTAPLHLFWSLVGASGGVLALWGYAGLRLRSVGTFEGSIWTYNGFATVFSRFLVISIVGIAIIELVSLGNVGHLMGLGLGCLYYGYEETVGTPPEIDGPGPPPGQTRQAATAE